MSAVAAWKQLNLRIRSEARTAFDELVKLESDRAGTKLSMSVVFSMLVKRLLDAERQVDHAP